MKDLYSKIYQMKDKELNRNYLSLALMLGSAMLFLFARDVSKSGEIERGFFTKEMFIGDSSDSYLIYAVWLSMVILLGVVFLCSAIYLLVLEYKQNKRRTPSMKAAIIIGSLPIIYFSVLIMMPMVNLVIGYHFSSR